MAAVTAAALGAGALWFELSVATGLIFHAARCRNRRPSGDPVSSP